MHPQAWTWFVQAQASAGVPGIARVVVFAAAGICRHPQASTVWWVLQVQASACIRRHRQCGGFCSCRHLQASAGIDGVVVFTGAGICRHLQSSQNHGCSERRQPHPVWCFKSLKGGRGRVRVAASGRDESIVVTLAAQTGWREAVVLIEARQRQPTGARFVIGGPRHPCLVPSPLCRSLRLCVSAAVSKTIVA